MSGAQLPLLTEVAGVAYEIAVVLLQAAAGFLGGFLLGYFLERGARR